MFCCNKLKSNTINYLIPGLSHSVLNFPLMKKCEFVILFVCSFGVCQVQWIQMNVIFLNVLGKHIFWGIFCVCLVFDLVIRQFYWKIVFDVGSRFWLISVEIAIFWGEKYWEKCFVIIKMRLRTQISFFLSNLAFNQALVEANSIIFLKFPDKMKKKVI